MHGLTPFPRCATPGFGTQSRWDCGEFAVELLGEYSIALDGLIFESASLWAVLTNVSESLQD